MQLTSFNKLHDHTFSQAAYQKRLSVFSLDSKCITITKTTLYTCGCIHLCTVHISCMIYVGEIFANTHTTQKLVFLLYHKLP